MYEPLRAYQPHRPLAPGPVGPTAEGCRQRAQILVFFLGLAAEDEVCERDEGVALLRRRQPRDSVDSTLRMEERERPRSIYPVRLQHIPSRQYLYFWTVKRGLLYD